MVAPYAFNDRKWIGYDDEQSATIKTEYIIENDLGGKEFRENKFNSAGFRSKARPVLSEPVWSEPI